MASSTYFYQRWTNKASNNKQYFRRSGRSCFFILGGLCGVFLLIAVVAAGIWWLYLPKHTVSTSLRIATSEPSVLSSNAKKFTSEEFEGYKKIQKELITNRVVLNAALRKSECSPLQSIKDEANPVEWLKSKLQITFPGQSEIMQVTISGENKKELAILVNSVVDAYLTETAEMERRKRDERISELKSIQISKMQEVKDTLSELRRIADALGTSDTEMLNVKQKNLLDELALVRQEYLHNLNELNRMTADLKVREAQRDAMENMPISDVKCELYASSDFILKKLQDEIILRKISSNLKNNAELDRLEKEYSQRIEQIRSEIGRERRAEISLKIKEAEGEIAMFKKMLDASQEELKDLRKKCDSFGTSTIDMQMRRAATKNNQKVLDEVTAELEELRIESRSVPRITVLQRAEGSD
jgi:polysaccharide biosynthesis transport protein